MGSSIYHTLLSRNVVRPKRIHVQTFRVNVLHERTNFFNRSPFGLSIKLTADYVIIMLNFHNPTKLFWVLMVGLLSSSAITQNTHYYTNLVDISSRVWLNDFVLNSYYFYWTSFWYLLSVISLLKVLSTWSYVRVTNWYYIYVLFALFVYTMSLLDYWGYIFISSTDLRYESQINALLTNSINKYHPFIFYVSLIWVYVGFILVAGTVNNARFGRIQTKAALYQKFTSCLALILFTLSLGSWWALQEGSWGGWWNWDSSEVFGLLVMIIYIQNVHQVLTKTTNIDLKSVLTYAITLLLLSYILIQLNFDLVSHNFGTKTAQFISSDQFYYFLVSILLTLTVVYSLANNRTLVTYTDFQKINPTLTKTGLLVLITSITVLLSFSELLNNFYWLISESNFINVLNLTTYYVPLLLTVLYLLLLRLNMFTLTALTGLAFGCEYVFILGLVFVKRSSTTFLHVLIFLFVLTTHQALNQSLSHWNLLDPNTYSFIPNSLLDNYNFLLKVNTSYLECSFTELIDNQLIDIGWSFIQNQTTLQSHAFQHNLQSSITFQGLLVSLLEYTHNILVWDYSTQVLSILVSVILFSTLNLSFKWTLIIF